MKYFVTDCITGVTDGIDPFDTLEEAMKVQKELNEKRKAEGGSDEFWIIIDEDGKECK